MPVGLLEILRIDEGDVLELTADDRTIVSGRGMKLVPTSLFTEEMLEELRNRQKSLDSDGGIDVKDMNQLPAKILNPEI